MQVRAVEEDCSYTLEIKAVHKKRVPKKSEGWGCPMLIKIFLNVNIINYINVNKPKRGGADNVDKVILLTFGTF